MRAGPAGLSLADCTWLIRCHETLLHGARLLLVSRAAGFPQAGTAPSRPSPGGTTPGWLPDPRLRRSKRRPAGDSIHARGGEGDLRVSAARSDFIDVVEQVGGIFVYPQRSST